MVIVVSAISVVMSCFSSDFNYLGLLCCHQSSQRFLNFAYPFKSIYFIDVLYIFILDFTSLCLFFPVSFILLILGMVCSWFSKSLRCTFRFCIWYFYICICCCKLPQYSFCYLSQTLMCCHCHLFLEVFWFTFIPLPIDSRSVLFNFHVFWVHLIYAIVPLHFLYFSAEWSVYWGGF